MGWQLCQVSYQDGENIVITRDVSELIQNNNIEASQYQNRALLYHSRALQEWKSSVQMRNII